MGVTAALQKSTKEMESEHLKKRQMSRATRTKLFTCLLTSMILGVTSLMANPIVLVEAEAFKSKGGWVVDPQFMDQMGSPYLLARGLGHPVEDASTTVKPFSLSLLKRRL